MLEGQERMDQLTSEIQAAFEGSALRAVVHAALEDGDNLTPLEMADVIMPPRDPSQALPARWVLAEEAGQKVRDAANQPQNAERILSLAEALGMKKPLSVDTADLINIDRDRSIWIVEGGANKTSIVRRELARQALDMRLLGPVEDVTRTIYQFGSTRAINPERNSKPNAEYEVARDITGTFFVPEGESLTEFELNLRTAQNFGYDIQGQLKASNGLRALTMRHMGRSPQLAQVELSEEDGFMSGFSVLHHTPALAADIDDGSQFVITTNGQYRPKDEVLAIRWAQQHDVDMQPPVIFGDEAGFSVPFGNSSIDTRERGPVIYLNEMVVLARMLLPHPDEVA